MCMSGCAFMTMIIIIDDPRTPCRCGTVVEHVPLKQEDAGLAHGTLHGEGASRCNNRHKGACCNPKFLRTHLVVHRLFANRRKSV